MENTETHHPITGEELVPAIPAATMVIFNRNPDGGPPLLLMMERIKQMAFAGGAAVFPGGRVDDADFAYAENLIKDGQVDGDLSRDEVAARLAAIRETLEEAGLALALEGVDDPADCEEARAALHDGATLANICGRFDWQPDLEKLIPWSRWRPPRGEARTFDTRFYLIDAGDTPLNAKVDNTENKSLFWDSASGVMERANRGEVKIIFPTRRNLERLALFEDFESAAAHAKSIPVTTVLTYIEERADGIWLCIPDGHGYPETEETMESAMRG